MKWITINLKSNGGVRLARSKAGKASLLVVTNIPTPYRTHQFNILADVLGKHQVNFEVAFLATGRPGRTWKSTSFHYEFSHRFVASLQLHFRGLQLYFSPGLWLSTLVKPPTWLWLGGSWFLPTIVGLSWLTALRRKSWILGWNESTVNDQHTIKDNNRFALQMRHFLLRPYNGWVVPGERAKEFVSHELAIPDIPIISFANTVDTSLFHNRVLELRQRRSQLRTKWGILPDRVMCLWPARLIAEKGILPFLDAIQCINSFNYQIVIAGDGPLKTTIETRLAAHGVSNVVLVGYQQQESMLELYAIADVLLLPSLSETYGFAAVEGAWAELPLFLSTNVGAIPEVLQPGVNGWVVNMQDPNNIRAGFSRMLSCNPDQLRQMGHQSRYLVQQHLDSYPAAERFVSKLLTTFAPRS